MLTSLNIHFSDTQGQITLKFVVVSGQNLNSSKLLCMFFLPAKIRKMEKNEGATVFTRFLSLCVYGNFSRRSRAANSTVLIPIWPNFELVRDIIDFLVICKYEEDPIKNEGARVLTTFSPL